MSPTVDFTDWAVPDLVIPLGGHTYTVRPPSVARAPHVLACAVRAEHTIGLAHGPIPPDMQATLDALDATPLADVTLGADVHAQMVADGHPPLTIDRVAYYAMLYWARGRAQADAIATLMWSPRDDESQGEQAPKAARRSRSKSGHGTASASPTLTASTPTTGSPPS